MAQNTQTKVHFEGRVARPVAEVFDAVVDNAKLSKYFVSRSSGPLVAGRTVTWYFDDVGVELNLLVLSIDAGKRIHFQWSASGSKAEVEMTFDTVGNETRLRIRESGWPMERKGVMQALGQMSGWTDFFNSLKAYLLFNIDLRRGVMLPKALDLRDAVETAQDYAPDVSDQDQTDAQGNATGQTIKNLSWTIGGITIGVVLGAGGMYLAQPNMCVAPAAPAQATTTSAASPTPRPAPSPATPASSSGTRPTPAAPASSAATTSSSSATGII